MIPAVQLILAFAGILFSPGILQRLGLISPPAGDNSTSGRVYVMPDHPSAQATSTAPSTGSTGSTGGTAAPSTGSTGGAAPSNGPSTRQIVGGVLGNGWILGALGLVFLTAPLTISQLRAAGHDLADGTRGVYAETQRGYGRVRDADDHTGLERHRRRSRK